MIIIGGGRRTDRGLYAARANMNAVLFEAKESAARSDHRSHRRLPGSSRSPGRLANKLPPRPSRLGIRQTPGEQVRQKATQDRRTEDGTSIAAYAVIVKSGASKKLGVTGEAVPWARRVTERRRRRSSRATT